MVWKKMDATLLGAALLILWMTPTPSVAKELSPDSLPIDLGEATPRTGLVSGGAIDAARLAAQVVDSAPVAEHIESMKAEREMTAARESAAGGVDVTQNACHYARGSTLIMHVFINHLGGVWDASSRGEAAAKAVAAKEFYLDEAPLAANLSFDHGTSDSYYFAQVFVSQTLTTNGWESANAALANLGVTDDDGDGFLADDYSQDLEFFDGGWDNVMLVFQVAELEGRAWASSLMSACFLNVDESGNIWAHEWGHLFGACDEYVEGGGCHNGTNCGVCPRPMYLDEPYFNGNCELAGCPPDVECLMQRNQFEICPYTWQLWSWEDEDGNGQLDWTRRFDGGNEYDLMEMWNGGWFVHNTTTGSFVAPVTEPGWTVFGLRSPPDADYDMRLFLDNNLIYQPARSGQSGANIDFVVGDYSRSRMGLEHVQVERFSGSTPNYNVVWQGSQSLYADGVSRNAAWSSNDVVQVFNLTLFAGETVTFDMEASGGIDAGMALFWSYGRTFFAGRYQALWERDTFGLNGTEVYTYDVPSTGTYGLVVWTNNAAAGNTSITVGPGPITLAEESPVFSAAALRLFNYTGLFGFWAGVATRPDAGTDVSLTLYDDSTYLEEEASSNEPADEVELIAVHYGSRPADTDHLRIPKLSGTGGYRTEWEQSSDRLTGVVNDTWTASHVVKMWDVLLAAGKTYVFRLYNSVFPPRIDAGLYLFGPAAGDAQSKTDAVAESDIRTSVDGGEWFTYTATTSADHGLAMVMNNEPEDDYSLWWGPRIGLADGESERSNSEVVFGANAVLASDWIVWGARPNGTHRVEMQIMSESGYSGTLESSTDVEGVNLIVSDRNHATDLDTRYPRFRTIGGPGVSDYQYEGGLDERLPHSHSVEELDLPWPAGDVAISFDLFLNGDRDLPQSIEIQLEVLTGNLDLGLAIFRSDNRDGESIQTIADAEFLVDSGGVGEPESITYSTIYSDVIAVVIFNKNSNAGTYRIRTFDPGIVTAAEAPVLPTELSVSVDRNPLRHGTEVRFSLPESAPVDLRVFDVSGRLVRSLVSGTHDAGNHTVEWDGRTRDGALIGTGIYFIRLDVAGETRVVKAVQSAGS